MKRFIYLWIGLFSLAAAYAENITWSSPQSISTSGVNATDPSVGMDGSGNIWALWVEDGGALMANYLPLGGNWGTAQTLSLTAASLPAVAVDPSGNVTAIWLQGTALYTASLPSGGSWGLPLPLDLGVVTGTPVIAVDASGNVVAAWTSSGAILSNTKLINGSWQLLPDTLSTDGVSDSQRVAIGGEGTVVAVWHSTVAATDGIYASQKTLSGGIWSPLSPQVSSIAWNSVNPDIAVDDNGNALAIWYMFQGTDAVTNVIVQSSYMANGGTWGLAQNISNPGVYDPTKLMARVQFVSSGSAIAAWNQSYDGSTFTIESTVMPSGGSGTWVTPTVQLISGNAYAYGFSLGALTTRDAFLLNMFFDGVSSIVIDTQSTNIDALAQNFWLTPVIVSTGTTNGFPIFAGVIDGENIYTSALWISFNGTNTTIQAVTGVGQVLQPPSNLSVMQSSVDAGIFTEYQNTINWTASTSPNLQLYYIYRNGIWISSVPYYQTQYVDPNQSDTGSITYGISSFDIQGTESGQSTTIFTP